MKILGLVASGRKMGNSEILAKAMLSALPESIEKEMIRLTDLAIDPCRACYACLPGDKYCVIHDDLAFLLTKIKEADGVIITSPCYFLGSHTVIKSIGDRLISLLSKTKELSRKPCITAITYGIPEWEGYAPEAVNNFARFLHLDLAGTMTVQAASPGEVIRPDIISEAKNLAQRLLQPLQDDATEPSEQLICPVCQSRLLEISRLGNVRCVMCGVTGTISSKQNELSIHLHPQNHNRFSPAGLAAHSELLTEIKETYLLTRKELAMKRKEYSELDWWVKPGSLL